MTCRPTLLTPHPAYCITLPKYPLEEGDEVVSNLNNEPCSAFVWTDLDVWWQTPDHPLLQGGTHFP